MYRIYKNLHGLKFQLWVSRVIRNIWKWFWTTQAQPTSPITMPRRICIEFYTQLALSQWVSQSVSLSKAHTMHQPPSVHCVCAQKSRHRTSLSFDIEHHKNIYGAPLSFSISLARAASVCLRCRGTQRLQREKRTRLNSVQDKCARPAFAFECISPHNGLRELSSAWSKGYSPAALFISLMSGSHKKVSPTPLSSSSSGGRAFQWLLLTLFHIMQLTTHTHTQVSEKDVEFTSSPCFSLAPLKVLEVFTPSQFIGHQMRLNEHHRRPAEDYLWTRESLMLYSGAAATPPAFSKAWK